MRMLTVGLGLALAPIAFGCSALEAQEGYIEFRGGLGWPVGSFAETQSPGASLGFGMGRAASSRLTIWLDIDASFLPPDDVLVGASPGSLAVALARSGARLAAAPDDVVITPFVAGDLNLWRYGLGVELHVLPRNGPVDLSLSMGAAAATLDPADGSGASVRTRFAPSLGLAAGLPLGDRVALRARSRAVAIVLSTDLEDDEVWWMLPMQVGLSVGFP